MSKRFRIEIDIEVPFGITAGLITEWVERFTETRPTWTKLIKLTVVQTHPEQTL